MTHTALALIPYPSSNLDTASFTFDICPQKAASTTPTSGGPIGILITGEVLYDPYEASRTTAALSDNAQYPFTPAGSTQQTTAYVIDACNSHSTTTQSGTVQWHYHGVPTCLTDEVDGTTGPSHIIGVAFDGFPIYGGRDINGNVIATSQRDACNGITSPTTVPAPLAAQASRFSCGAAAIAAYRRAELRATRAGKIAALGSAGA